MTRKVKIRQNMFQKIQFMYRKPIQKEQTKLKPKWDGPYRIVKVLPNNLTYILKHKDRKTEEVVHHNRMKKGFFSKPWKSDHISSDEEKDKTIAPVYIRRPCQFYNLFNNHYKWENC